MADNTITVVGNLTRDPEIRYTPSGQANARLGVAVSRRWQNRQTNEWEERTSFFNVVCLGRHGRERQRLARQGHRVIVQRPARAAQLGDRAGREAQRRRDRRRRDRPEPALGHRRGEALRASRWRRPGRRRRWRRLRPAAAVAADVAGAGPGARWRRHRPTTSATKSPSSNAIRNGAARTMARDRERRGKDQRPPTEGARPRRRCRSSTRTSIDWVDYKDVNLLRRFMSERAKIRARRVTGNNQQQQREVAKAIRIAREMALLPYSVRQVTQRSRSGRRDRGDRAGPERADADAGRAAARSSAEGDERRAARGRVDRRGRGDRRRDRRSPTPASGDRRGGLSREDRPARRRRAARQEGRPPRGRRRLRPQLPRAARAGDRRDQGRRRSRPRPCVATARSATTATREAAQELADAARRVSPVAGPGACGRGRQALRLGHLADIAAAVEAADRRRGRPAQDRARRAAQGARSRRGRRSRSTPTCRDHGHRRGRRRAERVRDTSVRRGPHPGAVRRRACAVSRRSSGVVAPAGDDSTRVDVHSPVDEQAPLSTGNSHRLPGVVHFQPTGPRCDDAAG